MKKMNESMKNAEQLRKEAELLREKKEELFFEMMFAAFDETDAPKYEALNEQLKNDPTCQASEDEDKAMLEFIAREIKKRDEALAKEKQDDKENSKTAKKPARRTRSRIVKVAVIAAILLLIGATTAYATIPSFRVMTLNLLVEISDEATRIAITDGTERTVDNNIEVLEGTEIVLLGYKFPEVPKELYKIEERYDDTRAWIQYANGKGKSVKYQVYNGLERDVAFDTEDAAAIDIEIHGYEGLLSSKGLMTTVSWYDEENRACIVVITTGFDEDIAFSLACDVEKTE